MRRLLCLALATLCACESPKPDTFPALDYQRPTVCLPAGYTVISARAGAEWLLLAEEQPARPRTFVSRWQRVVECGADAAACPCAPLPQTVEAGQ